MIVAQKLREYLESNGTQFRWFAEKIGMSKQHLYQCMSQNKHFHHHFWEKIIEETKGYISISDFIADELSKVENLEILAKEKTPYEGSFILKLHF